MWNLWKPFPAEPQVFNLFYGDKNATLLKLLSELNEMVDVKHLFSINSPHHPQQTTEAASLLSSECPVHQQSHSMEVWQEFWKAFNRRLFMFGLLVPVSDVTWQISTHPALLSHSSLALCMSHLLETFLCPYSYCDALLLSSSQH